MCFWNAWGLFVNDVDVLLWNLFFKLLSSIFKLKSFNFFYFDKVQNLNITMIEMRSKRVWKYDISFETFSHIPISRFKHIYRFNEHLEVQKMFTSLIHMSKFKNIYKFNSHLEGQKIFEGSIHLMFHHWRNKPLKSMHKKLPKQKSFKPFLVHLNAFPRS